LLAEVCVARTKVHSADFAGIYRLIVPLAHRGVRESFRAGG